MFRIYAAEDAALQQRCAQLCGAAPTGAPFVHVMEDGQTGEIMGFSRVDIDGSVGLLTDLRPRVGTDDGEAMFILGRATLNFLELCGVQRCLCPPDAADGRLLHAIGFRPGQTPDAPLVCDMTGMFDGHCGGHSLSPDTLLD